MNGGRKYALLNLLRIILLGEKKKKKEKDTNGQSQAQIFVCVALCQTITTSGLLLLWDCSVNVLQEQPKTTIKHYRVANVLRNKFELGEGFKTGLVPAEVRRQHHTLPPPRGHP